MHFGIAASLVAAAFAGALAAPDAPEAVSPCLGVSKTANTSLASVIVAGGLSSPVFATSPPGDTQRLFIVEKAGRIKIHRRGDPVGTTTTFLDISGPVDDGGSELGLLGLAFDPAYATTLHFWVNYTENSTGPRYTVVSRFTASAANPNVADPASELKLLRFLQPEENHNGGMLAFGKDGFLYVFSGDGGGGGDLHGTCGNGQNRSTLLGKVLRLDVRGIDPDANPPECSVGSGVYGIPASNPLADGPGGNCDEIWAYGLRNPWRSTIDRLTGDMYVADVGQNCWEEVNFAPAVSPGGENYGWRQMEAGHCFNFNGGPTCDPVGAICAGSPPCNDPSFTDPVAEFDHEEGCAVTGGYVYRGCRMSAWQGTYFYGDYCGGFVRTFQIAGGVATNPADVTGQIDPTGQLPGSLSSFGEDAQGEIYVVSFFGTVRKIVPPFADLEVSAADSGTRFTLSRTGDWTWENLFLSTEVPVAFYRVYRGTPGGSYTCVFKPTTPVWPAGGDPAAPAPGQLFAYVVVGVNATGQQTLTGTVGTFNATTCP